MAAMACVNPNALYAGLSRLCRPSSVPLPHLRQHASLPDLKMRAISLDRPIALALNVKAGTRMAPTLPRAANGPAGAGPQQTWHGQYNAFKRLQKEGQVLTPGQKAHVDHVRDYTSRGGKTAWERRVQAKGIDGAREDMHQMSLKRRNKDGHPARGVTRVGDTGLFKPTPFKLPDGTRASMKGHGKGQTLHQAALAANKLRQHNGLVPPNSPEMLAETLAWKTSKPTKSQMRNP